ncbi:MAG: sensor histidine kinase [Coriobacteriia bacterium]
MDWLVPSIVASLAGSIVLASVFVYLAGTEHEECMVSWAAAWILYTLRLVFDLIDALTPASFTAAILLAYAAAIASGLLLLLGTFQFIGRRQYRAWLLTAGLAAFVVSLTAVLAGAPLAVAAAPAYVVQGAAHLITGIAWSRQGRMVGPWARITAAGFLLWGVHKLDYPLLRGIPSLAPFGFLLGGVLALTVAVGALVSYFERTRRLLAASEMRYRALFENSSSAMLIIDPVTGMVVDANESAEHFYGWSREELRAKRIGDINTLSPEEIAVEMAAAREHRRLHFNFCHRLASGEIRDVEVFSGPVPGDEYELLYSIIHDVTERVSAQRALEESEERYRTLFYDSQQIMMLVDPHDARIVEANDAAAIFYGYQPQKLRAMTIADLSVDGLGIVLQEVRATIEEHRQVGLYKHVTVDGSIHDVEVYSTPVRYGEHTLMFTIVHDVTMRAEDERELARYRLSLEEQVEARTAELRSTMTDLEAATAAKDDFLASMSHELRTPLNSVIGFAHLLGQELPGPINDEQRKQIGMIERSGKHLLNLVNDVLDLSKIESGELEVRMVEIDASQVASEIAASLQSMVAGRGLELIVDTCAGITVQTDPHLLEQILWNLLGNAIKYTDEGHVRLCVGAFGNSVRFVVSDTGPGMTPKQLEGAFEKFTRFHGPGGEGGTGLGLSIAARLAEHLGGRIEAASMPGEGSTFTLTLPRAEPGVD